MFKLQPNISQEEDYDKLQEAVVTLPEKSKPEMLDKFMSSFIFIEKVSFYLNELITQATRIVLNYDIKCHEFFSSFAN